MDKENGAGNSLKTVFLRLIRMAIIDYDRLTNMHPGDRRIPSENRHISVGL